MSELPTGTVTFLFTDIEGSTRLLEELGPRYGGVLEEHRRVLRQAFERHEGVEVDTQGDAFFVAFARATDALGAAEEAQGALELPVRMGIHTGEPQLTEQGYVGIDVHRAARICAAAHGGQVLVSRVTRELVGSHLRDLGEHRLKDLSEPERIFQLGDEEFPPPRTLNRTNLPVQPTPLIGREQEVAQVVDRLSDTRIVTLTGPGGVGKTRLALQAAAEASERFPDGVFFVGLQAVRDHELVIPAVANALEIEEELEDWLEPREVLLVLDNLEQVVGCGSDLAALVSGSPRLRLLCTSREPLRVYGEAEYSVQPLAEDEGVELFRQRAIESEPAQAVRAICARLDGLPLAIELAAARTRVLAPSALLERLDRALPLLVHGPRDASAGGRTLRATIEWSYDLLEPHERGIFDRLAVFAGGCTLDEAEQVADASLETLESLLEKAMFRRSGDRYSMLQVVREFALERLRERGEIDLRMNRFAELLLAGEEDESQWTRRADLDNWRAVVDWGMSAADPDTALRLAGLSGWRFRPKPAEAVFQGKRALLERGAEASPRVRARLLSTIALQSLFAGDFDSSVAAETQAAELFRQVGDARGLQDSLSMLGGTLKQSGRNEDAERVLKEALEVALELGPDGTPWLPLHALGELERDRGNLTVARELLERSVEACRRAGVWEHAQGSIRHGLGDLALEEANFEEARSWYLEGLAIAREHDAYYTTVHCIGGLAAVAAAERRIDEAASLWAATEHYSSLRGAELGATERQRYLARLALVPLELVEAAREQWKDATAPDVEDAAAAAGHGPS